jgi:hypothetical protein
LKNFYSIAILSVFIAGLFLGSVLININVKNSKNEINRTNEEIKDIIKIIKRQEIEITSLTNPQNVIKYIKEHELKPVSLSRKVIIYVDN